MDQAAARSGPRALRPEDRLLTPGEVAEMFRVDPKTVTRWAAAGRISSIRTPGGHRRFLESEVRALLEQGRTVTAPAGTTAQIPPQTTMQDHQRSAPSSS